MAVFTVRHDTVYRYRRGVAFGDHRMMLRPRGDAGQEIRDFRLEITPAPAEILDERDPFGNTVTVARFDGRTRASELRFTSRATVDQKAARIPAVTAPVPPPEAEAAGRSSLDGWARLFDRQDSELGVAIAMTKAIDRGFRHVPRHEKGIQPPAETLALGSGTCRDFAVLMMAALGRHRIAARFVSGYLHIRGDSPERTRGGNTHAWVEAEVDGRGIDFDPSHGTVGNAGLLRVAVVEHPADAVPLAGTWFGKAADAAGMEVAVRVLAA